MEQPSSSQPDNGSTGAQELPLQPGPAILSADAVQDHSHTDYPVSQEQPTLPATAETALGDTSSKAQHDNTTNERAPNSQEHPQAATEAIAAPDGVNTQSQNKDATNAVPQISNNTLEPSALPPQADAINQGSSHEGASNSGNEEARRISNDEQEWPLKSIYWPPFVEHPDQVKILMQDLNGPCSFLALCNVLLLRGDIRIPLEQKSATFSQLSGLLGDYLLRSTTSSSSTSSETSSHNLSFVLNTLPKTLSGLDVNINFITGGFSGSETGSSSSTSASSTSKPGELELFKLANVECKHGWLASEDDKKAYEVLLSVANDYDTAVNVLVEGDEIAEGNITGNSVPSQPPSNIISESVGETIPPSTSNMSNAQRLEQLFEGLSMEPNKQAKVYQATIIQRFLQNTGTQLTYAGLFKLSESLQPNSLCALFRNSHFSVLYRRPDELPYDPTAQSAQDNSENNNNVQTGTRTLQLPQATLFQLVTDQALLHEPNAIWESLEDIDGAASTFFDSRLQPAKIRQDWVARNERDPEMVGANDEMHDADMALAAQLQQDEYDAEDHARQQYNQQNNNNNNRQSIQVPVPNINDSSRSGRRDVSSSSSSAGHREQIQGSPGGRRTEDLHPKLLSGLGAKAPKKSKEKVGSTDDDDKKKKKPGCIIS